MDRLTIYVLAYVISFAYVISIDQDWDPAWKHELLVGTFVTSRRPDFQEFVAFEKRCFRVTYGTAQYSTGKHIIKAVWVHTLKPDCTGGYARVLAGGPFSKYVHLRFRSGFGRGMSFRIRIYWF